MLLLAALLALAGTARATPPLAVVIGDTMGRDFPDYPCCIAVDIQGWGHDIPNYFGPGVTWQNFSVGHQSTKSYLAEGRLAGPVAAHPRFALINLGFIDITGESDTYTTTPAEYRQNLHQMVVALRSVGAEPIFVTPPPIRNTWDHIGIARPSGFEPWVDAMIAQGADDGVPVIDLHGWLLDTYEQLGWPTAQKLYGLDQDGVPDTVHFSNYGADQVARHIAQSLPALAPDLAAFLSATPAPALPGWWSIFLVVGLGIVCSTRLMQSEKSLQAGGAAPPLKSSRE
jgi:lysophospholipase L1-like esterase